MLFLSKYSNVKNVKNIDFSYFLCYIKVSDVKQYASLKKVLKFKNDRDNEVFRKNFKQIKRIINQKL